VDVTTEDPGVEALRKTSTTDSDYGVRVVITPSNFYQNAGGVAYVGSFNTGAGRITLTITPGPRGANLDVLARLYTLAGKLVGWSNPAGLGATISVTVPAGVYYLGIEGIWSGDPLVTGYSDYASLGQYTLTGKVVSP